MERSICRTCLKTNLSQMNCLKIFDKGGPNQITTMKDMLEKVMPEMDLDISDDETVICLQCSESLKIAYMFKNNCLKTEDKIYDYLHRQNIHLGKKICLNNVVDYEVDLRDTPCDLKYNPKVLEKKCLLPMNDDSNQSSSVFTQTPCFTGIDSEPGKKEVVLPKSRKRRSHSEKSGKDCDFSALKRSYTCDLCEYKAYRLDLLDTHKQKHDKNLLNIKEYKCELCLYSTPRKRALDRHLFTHKGQSQHLCETCNKPFAERYQLRLHAITHTSQELPHKCEDCGKSFLTKSYLKQHMETRHLIKKKELCLECNQDKCGHLFSRCYKCNVCESSFSDKRGLDAHKFTHTGGELPYKCLHCSFSTAWKGNLKKHLRNKH